MSDKNYFNVVIKGYEILGLRKSSPFVKKIVAKYVLFPVFLTMYGMILMNFKYKSGDIFEIVEVFESTSTFSQLLIRKLTLLLYSGRIEDIISKRSQFWKYVSFDEEFISRFDKKKQQAFTKMKIFWCICTSAVVVVVSTPFFVEDHILPSSCWLPTDNKLFFLFMYLLETMFLIELILLSIPTDAFFLFLCTDLEMQLMLLSKTINSVKIGNSSSSHHEEECLQKLKKCSAYHRFLLKVHEELSTVFSIYFVLQFLINVVGNTMQFYILSNTPGDLTQVLRCIVYLATVLFQGSISFLPASNIEIEGENLANEIYSIDWYNTPNVKIRKFVLFGLMNAQKPLQMSGGGLMTINRNVFLLIPRTSFSVYTILN